MDYGHLLQNLGKMAMLRQNLVGMAPPRLRGWGFNSETPPDRRHEWQTTQQRAIWVRGIAGQGSSGSGVGTIITLALAKRLECASRPGSGSGTLGVVGPQSVS